MFDEIYSNMSDAEKNARIEEAELTVKKSEKLIAKAKALTELKSDKNFKLIFDEGYFSEYAEHIFDELTLPKHFAEIPSEDCKDILEGIKSLKYYIGFNGNAGIVENEAVMATHNLEQAHSVLNAIG
jgi:hypothetical protein